METLPRNLEQPASTWTQISCSNTLEQIDFSAFNRVRLKAGRSRLTMDTLPGNQDAARVRPSAAVSLRVSYACIHAGL